MADGKLKLTRVAVLDEKVVHHMVLHSVGDEVRLLVCARVSGQAHFSRSLGVN